MEHIRSLLVEETHYYPFGLPMNGISSKAASFGNPSNKLKYNGKEEQREEFSDGSGLEWTDYGARMYDNQLGRWFNIDAKAEKFAMFSPYNYTLNNPLKYIDPDGNDIDIAITKQQKNGQTEIKATATINVTIVDPKTTFGETGRAALAQMGKNLGGTIYTTTKDAKGKEITTVMNVSVEMNITIVDDVKKAKGTDYIIAMVDNIPAQNTSEGYLDPVGLASGDVAAVEQSGTGKYKTEIVFHELGHILGLDHTPNTFMNKNVESDPKKSQTNVTNAQRAQAWDWIKNLPAGNNKNKWGTPADSKQELKDFLNSSNIQ